jgi:hypothetical protein
MSASKPSNVINLDERRAVTHCFTSGTDALRAAVAVWPTRWAAETIETAKMRPHIFERFDLHVVSDLLDDLQRRLGAASPGDAREALSAAIRRWPDRWTPRTLKLAERHADMFEDLDAEDARDVLDVLAGELRRGAKS